MSDRVQVGPTVDEDLWREFREHVKARKGQVRGVLGDELENAIRNYIHHGPDKSTPAQIAEVNQRLQRIEGAVGTAETDGGVHTSDAETHTRAPSRLDVDERPASNAATDKKVAWLAKCVRDEAADADGDISVVSGYAIREVVKDEYGFRRDTAKRYVEKLVDHFDLLDHPKYDDQYCSPERYDELMEQMRDQQRDKADDRMEALDNE